jgi:hypothetical protein
MAEQHAISQNPERAVNDNRASQSTPPPARPQPVAPEPTSQERWRQARPTKMLTFWLMLGAVALTLVIGFTWGGWTTAAAAQKQADVASQATVVQTLAGICATQFGLDGAHTENLAALQTLGTSQRASYISDGGWATMPGKDEPDSKVVSECVKQVLAIAAK